MADNEVTGICADDYKWLVIKVVDNIIEGGIFTDIKMMSRYLDTSDKTIRRRLSQMNGTGRIKINGYVVTKMPYYKSKRGFSDGRKRGNI